MNGVSSSRTLGLCASLAVAIGLALTAPAARAAAPELSAEERQEIAVEAYIFAYPAVLMEKTRQVMTHVYSPPNPLAAPMNQFAHMTTLKDDKFEWVVRPNADTLYSSLWYDVGKEPVIVSVPDSGGRFHLVPFLDMWSDIVASPGTRTTGGGAQTFAIVDRDWHGKLPDGIRAYRSPTTVGWMIGRTLVSGKADLPAAQAFQAQISVRPLSAWGKKDYVPQPAAKGASATFVMPTEDVARMDPAEYYRVFAAATARNPAHPHDYLQLDRLARVGLVPGQPFDLNSQPPAVQDAFRKAPAIAQMRMLHAAMHENAVGNGWNLLREPMGAYGTDYLRRAYVAFFGLGANTVEDAVYTMAFVDTGGHPLDSGAKYIIHFEKGQLPPVRAFWSLSLYNDRQFLAANPINRFAIGDRDPLKPNPDGSVDIYVQRAAPDADKMANWLPAPAKGGFTMNFRFYWSREPLLNGSWKPPGIQRVD